MFFSITSYVRKTHHFSRSDTLDISAVIEMRSDNQAHPRARQTSNTYPGFMQEDPSYKTLKYLSLLNKSAHFTTSFTDSYMFHHWPYPISMGNE